MNTMAISLYTCVRNGLYLDYHVVEMLRHHLPLADEIVVNDGYSTDGTFETITRIDSKIKVFRSHWGTPAGQNWFVQFKEEARRRCTGDWCILLDPDEFIPEWEFDRLRKILQLTDRHIVRLDWVHFYGNYRVYNANPARHRWAQYKYQVHRNLDDMEIWGDGSNVRLKGRDYESIVEDQSVECHHFGVVRRPARLRQKFRFVDQVVSGRLNLLNLPGLIFDLMPYDWFDRDFLEDLAIYEGKHVQAVRDNPNEFVRDNLKLYDYLCKKSRK
jgi:glycosyltransferase involved in cell wall biosynthesis